MLFEDKFISNNSYISALHYIRGYIGCPPYIAFETKGDLRKSSIAPDAVDHILDTHNPPWPSPFFRGKHNGRLITETVKRFGIVSTFGDRDAKKWVP